MLKSEKKLKSLAAVLKKDNYLLISEAISLLRDEQPFDGAISLLTSFYDETEDRTIRKAVENFMNDLKDPSVRTDVINEIRKQWKPDTISMLVSSCWQSGLDYSDYSLDIAEVFLQCDYVTAIECITVISETADRLSRKKKDEIIKLIEESPISSINEKKTLNLEILSILRL